MPIYGFNQRDAQTLKRVAQRERVEPVRGLAGELILPENVGVWIAKAGGSGVGARSGTTPGSGTVTLYYISSGTLTVLQDLDGNNQTVTAYNLSQTAVAADAYIHIKMDGFGSWLIDFEDCG